MIVRTAHVDDAAVVCEVVRRSIRELCTADHHDDPATIEAWLANKTEQRFRGWIATHLGIVAERTVLDNRAIVGFGLLNRNGTLALLYVDPAARASGVGTALLVALEREARGLGLPEMVLESSTTALAFYERRGYTRCGEPVPGFGITVAHPLKKLLSAEA